MTVPIGRVRNNDPFHANVIGIVEEMREIRFYGKAKHAEFVERIEQIRHDACEQLIARELSGFDYNRIARDCERAVKLGEGKIFAAAMKHGEREDANRIARKKGEPIPHPKRTEPSVRPTQATMLERLHSMKRKTT